MSPREVMTPAHERWNDFLSALSHVAICARTNLNARKVLESMGEFDADASLEALRQLGGRCDCEIVFRVGGLEPSHV